MCLYVPTERGSGCVWPKPGLARRYAGRRTRQHVGCATYIRVRNKKIEINKTNGAPNQYTEYLNLRLENSQTSCEFLGAILCHSTLDVRKYD